MEKEEIRRIVRDSYSKVAKKKNTTTQSSCGCDSVTPVNRNCCSSGDKQQLDTSRLIGYSDSDLNLIPKDSDLGLGCGNPVAFSELTEGDTVLDLGSGAGMDCFLASQKVGKRGKVIGVDMTQDMLDLARKTAKRHDYSNVEFRLGEIENLPVGNDAIDVVISNCVINLSPFKQRVFEEAYRVLKKDGKMIISDLVLLKELPDEIRNNPKLIAGCVGGAVLKGKYIDLVKKAGFKDIEIIKEQNFGYEEETSNYLVDEKETSLKKPDIKQIYASIQSITLKAIK